VWHADAALVALSQRNLALLLSRWRAGTLYTLTPPELVFLTALDVGVPHAAGARLAVEVASDALMSWPQPHLLAEQVALFGSVLEVLRALLALDARSAQSAASTGLGVWRCFAPQTSALLDACGLVGGEPNDVLRFLRDNCRLAAGQEAALFALAARLRLSHAHIDAISAHVQAGTSLAGAADVARYGLRRCALPSCKSEEAHPKAHKLCGRCRGAAYCCAAHSTEDWQRHKREDGCKAAG
jgi:hypothetical protein